MKTGMEKMMTARATLITDHMFFGSLTHKLKIEECSKTKTASCDAVTVRFNPEYIESLTQAEVLGTYAHEILHPALGHNFRMGSREHQAWNEACDYVVNQILTDEGFTLPKGALLDAQYKGMNADEIYSQLMANKPPQPPKQKPQDGEEDGEEESNDYGGTGEMLAPPVDAANKGELADMEQDWNIATAQAENIAKSAGQDPEGATNATKAARKAVVDWRTILRRFIASASPETYAWLPPNRRFVHRGLYLPSLVSDRIGEIVVIRDTSGSTQFAQSQFMAELNDIVSEVKPETTHVIDCDVTIPQDGIAQYGPDELIPEVYCGGGGTSFKPPFDYIAEQGINPVCVIYLTDLDPNDGWPDEPPYPVLWVSCARSSQTVAPWGETVWMAPSQ